MPRIRIDHKALVLIADGRKALFLRNHGEQDLLDLRVEDVMSGGLNPKTADQGADRPGRIQDSATGRPSAYEQTDWHVLAEQDFAHTVGAALNELDRVGRMSSLIVVAPPAALAELRRTFSAALKGKIEVELHKDLTKHPLREIERLLAAGGH